MSMKVSPSIATSAVLGPDIPMLVPSPPLSLTIATWPSAAARSSSVTSISVSSGTSPIGSIESSGIRPAAPSASCLQ